MEEGELEKHLVTESHQWCHNPIITNENQPRESS